ncbi:serine hydrolase [Streptomyces sp. NPDC058045]|uniref:serine hydrolase n=1 Tax=Streptomyces sp. NPDC058045 TaxID=3346311 RepID=UPI0036E3A25F
MSRSASTSTSRFSVRAGVLAATAAVALSPVFGAGSAAAATEQETGMDRSRNSAPGAVNHDTRLAHTLAPLVARAGHGVRLSAAVAPLDGTGGGARYAHGPTFDTASIVKVDVLAALLLRSQDDRKPLTERQKTLAADMIRLSDNDATTDLWHDLGGEKALDAANRRLGLTGTHGGKGGEWGLTQTTADDQLRLLRHVFANEPGKGAPRPVFSAGNRAYLQKLMGRVDPGQAWGVSAAGSPCALKNGWLPRSATGRWDVNSVGRVTVGGHRYLVAVLSSGTPSMAHGVKLVEAAAKAAVGEIAPGGRH